MTHLDAAVRHLARASALIAEESIGESTLVNLADQQHLVDNLTDRLRRETDMVRAAFEIIKTDTPLSLTFKNGSRWGGTLTPTQIVSLAELATLAGPAKPTTTYRVNHSDRGLAEATRLECGREGCGGQRVRLANGLRAAMCYAHLSPEDKAEIRAERAGAAAVPCGFCGAGPGAPCVDLHTGELTTIHNQRLRPDLVR